MSELVGELLFDKEQHKYSVDGRDYISVTTVLKESGLINFYGNLSERNRKFGEALDETCHLYDNNVLKLGTLHSELLSYLNGWIKFKKDFEFEVQGSKKKMYSKRWGFAGEPDKIGTIHKNKKVIVEIKSGALIKHSICLQLAGYQVLEDENNPRTKVKERIGVQLLPDNYKIELFKDKSDCSSFLAFLQTVFFKRKYNLGGYDYGK